LSIPRGLGAVRRASSPWTAKIGSIQALAACHAAGAAQTDGTARIGRTRLKKIKDRIAIKVLKTMWPHLF
jgi:hypothetical protein